jgi:hypothetical protein
MKPYCFCVYQNRNVSKSPTLWNIVKCCESLWIYTWVAFYDFRIKRIESIQRRFLLLVKNRPATRHIFALYLKRTKERAQMSEKFAVNVCCTQWALSQTFDENKNMQHNWNLEKTFNFFIDWSVTDIILLPRIRGQ